MHIQQVLYGVNQRLRVEDVDSPLCEVRPVKTVLLVALTGDRGLCGGYNNFIIKKVRHCCCLCYALFMLCLCL
jgi:F-type H+-transporting ATPase subunit gamma